MRFRAAIQRDGDRPRFVLLPDDVVDALGLTSTTTVIGTMAGVAFDRLPTSRRPH
ncbi:MAG TPA: hypothetical protein VFU93_06450 [Acidimicrobiales bacterium]|nr:hypothetical protein [Acidimicrobiales bacterium]